MALVRIFSLLGLLLAFGVVGAAELVKLDTRDGVEQRLILVKPDGPPVASVILFAGGKGALNLSSFFGAPSMTWGKNNFLVRTRGTFADQGFLVAVVDAPSDRLSKRGMLGGFRNSAEHVQDIDAVIAYLRQQAAVPVQAGRHQSRYRVGRTRRAALAQRPDGLVLTFSMSVSNAKGTAVTEMPAGVAIPTQVVGHEQDGCPKTWPSGAQEIAAMLSAAPGSRSRCSAAEARRARNPARRCRTTDSVSKTRSSRRSRHSSRRIDVVCRAHRYHVSRGVRACSNPVSTRGSTSRETIRQSPAAGGVHHENPVARRKRRRAVPFAPRWSR